MNPGGPNPYLRTKILTASPQELRLMLYDGAIKFSRQAADALTAEDYETAYGALMRAQKIVLELSSSLNHEVAPELCSKLSGLYTFIYKKLVEANFQRKIEPVQDALKILEYERETWQLLIEKINTGGPDAIPITEKSLNGAQQTAISSLQASA